MPPLLGWILYLHPAWLPARPGNNGILIQPPRSLHDIRLQTPQGTAFDWHDLDDYWTLTIIGKAGCNEPCLGKLIQMRQSRRALGANGRRITRLLILLTGREGEPPRMPSLSGVEGTLVLLADVQNRESLVTLFDLELVSSENNIFVIDPRGALMMRHDTTAIPPQAIVDDLEVLLVASANWRSKSRRTP